MMSSFIRHILLLFFVLNYTVNLFSQGNSIIKGEIFDKESGKAIAHAEVTLNPTDKGSVSDALGSFSFHGLKPGKYELVVTHIAYQKYSETIILNENQTKSLTIYLEKKIISISGVEVQDEMIDRLPYVKEKILNERVRESMAGDVGSFLRSVPNVSGIRKGGSSIDPVVRGYKFSQLNVKINGGMGIEGGCPNRMDPAVSHVDILDVDNMEISKGPFNLRYGPSLGGLININIIRPQPYDKFEMHLDFLKSYESNWNGNTDHLAINGGNKSVYFRVSGNYRDYGDYTAGNGEVFNTSFREYNVMSQLGIAVAENQEILLMFDRSFGRDVHYPALPMDERTDDTKLMSIDYTAKDVSKSIYMIKSKLYASLVEHVMDNKSRAFGDTVVAISSIDAANMGFNFHIGLKLGKAYLNLGADMTSIVKDGKKHMTKIKEPMIPEFEFDIWSNAGIINAGVFAEYTLTFNNNDFLASARFDHNSTTSDPLKNKMKNYLNDDVDSDLLNLSFSLGLTRHFGENFSAGISLGRGVRSPDMIERFIVLLPIGYDNYDYLGNPQLDPEINNEVDIVLNYQHDKFGSFKLSGFYSYVQDFITGKQLGPSSGITPLTQGVLGVKQFYNADEVMFRGLEFVYRSPENYFLNARITAAYVRGTIFNPYYKLKELAGNDALSEIPPFEANASFSCKLMKEKLIPHLALRFVAPQNYVSVIADEKPTPGFVLADIGLRYIPNKILSFSGGIKNVFDKAYYEHLNRRIIGSRSNFYEPGRVWYVKMGVRL